MASDQDIDTATEPRGSFRRVAGLAARLCVAGSFLGWGMMLGVFFWRPQPALQPLPDVSREPAMVSSVVELADRDVSPPGETVGERIRRADEALRVGDAALALRIYEQLPRDSQVLLPQDQLMYRLAVAQELVGDFGGAMEHYRRLVLSSSSVEIKFPARLGQARLLIALGRPDAAQRLLGETLLSPAMAAVESSQLRAEALYLLADAQVGLVLGNESPRWLRDDGFARAMPKANAEPLLMMGMQREPPQEAGEVPEGVQVLHRFGKRPQDIQTQIHLPALPIPVALAKIAHSAECVLQLSPQAKALVTDRTVQIVIPNANLAILLDVVLGASDVAWQARGNRIQVYDFEELTAEQRHTYHDAQASRALRHALSYFPDHYRAPFAYHALGELEFYHGNYEEAATHFRQVVRRFPDADVQLTAAFNLAKSLLKTGGDEEVIELFYRVVDAGPGHPLRPVANCYAGRLFLERGEASQAVRPLLRGLTESTDGLTRRVSAVTLASAYLLAGNPHATNQLLMEKRSEFEGTGEQNTAAFLAALARFQVAGDSEAAVQDGRLLVNALGQMSTEEFFGDQLYLLVGKAMRLTGLLSSMREFYEQALASELVPWVRGQVQKELSEYLIAVGQVDAARQQLTELAAQSSSLSTRWAQIRLTRLHLDEREYAVCLEACRKLLDDELTPEETAVVLKQMGRAFAALGDHYQAALCFAGMIPPPDGLPPDDRLPRAANDGA